MSTSKDKTADIETFFLQDSLSHLLHRAQQMAATQSASALRTAGVTLRQFSVLAAASQEDQPSQSRLVELTGIDRSTLADMLQRMEQSGLIERTKSAEDGRAKSVSLTESGTEALSVAAPAVREADLVLINMLAKNRRASFMDLLNTLIDGPSSKAADEAREDKKSKKKAKGKKSKDKPKGKKAKDKKASKKEKA
ncbi:MAG: MarR family transcriptional regulator [Pseudomonadota bacterium]